MIRFHRRLCIILAGLTVTTIPVTAQSFSFGLKAGVPLTQTYSSNVESSQTFGTIVTYDRPYIVGATAEVHLPLHLSFEVDGLFRRNGFSYGNFYYPATINASPTRTTVNDWQLPFLVKYEVPVGPIRPFADGGVVYRHLGNSAGKSGETPGNPDTLGIAIGGGVTLKFMSLRLSPEIRYTHWPTRPFAITSFGAYNNQNEADFLLGLTF